MLYYRHTQIGYVIIILVLAGILWLAYLLVAKFHPILYLEFFIMILALALFFSLTVQINEQVIKIQFGIGVIHKQFWIDDIESYRIVENPWYYGWGIRYTPHGWLYRVSGSTAIELRMKNGRKFRIGTDDPDGLLDAIDQVFDGA